MEPSIKTVGIVGAGLIFLPAWRRRRAYARERALARQKGVAEGD